MNKRILVVDDTRTMKEFPKSTVYVRHIERAKESLLNTHWDEVWLDHDMGSDIYGYLEPDGTNLTDWIEQIFYQDNIKLDVDTFYVHSANPWGAIRMVSVLKNLGYNVVRRTGI